ncbi:hypothetical protein Aoki45_04140 [Algoriphagus sp. oki45]|uniref:hypothetical protein n=1 Tax=Algoriphagus sp. oki45 TaxID=3067294 RepID=UPI0027ED1D36|nr:hypothetical protein Aoki45_04140 [Algoriphagus sp. oki45]
MKTKKILRRTALGVVSLALVFGCQSLEEEQPLTQNDMGGGGTDVVLASVLAIEYDLANDNYYAVGASPSGDIDVYYGSQGAGWTKLQENRDIDNRYSPTEFKGIAFGANTGKFGNNIALGYGNKDGMGTSINGRLFSDKPYFGDGRPEQIGTLVEVLTIEYDGDNDNYIAVGVGPEGSIDVYVGYHKAWTKLQENRDIDNRYSPSQFVGIAFGGQGGNFGIGIGNIPNYTIGFRQTAPRATSINCREFYDKPYFGDGRPEAIEDGDEYLVRAFAVQYNAANDKYVVVGEGKNGDIDVFVGTHKNWTKLQENRDIDNRYSANEFVDFSIGGDGALQFGVAVGNKILDVNPLNGANNVDLQQRGTSINARLFSGNPYFGDGAPRIIGVE